MARGFQSRAFQRNAFQTDGITSTIEMPLPINCVLIGDQVYYRKTGLTLERLPGRSGSRVFARATGLQNLGGDGPSFTVKSNAKGYD